MVRLGLELMLKLLLWKRNITTNCWCNVIVFYVGNKRCCIALHCIALYCIVLYCIVLYCIVLW